MSVKEEKILNRGWKEKGKYGECSKYVDLHLNNNAI
jgi:hypothetical protein